MSARILVVDDQDDVREVLTLLLLRAGGWEVEEATSGDEALDAFRRQPADAVILDQRMPGLTGTEVARRLRGDAFHGPIVLFSAYLDDRVRAEADQLGLIGVPKSEINRVVDVLRDALDPGPVR